MREHTLSGTGGLTYAEMGRYQSGSESRRPGWYERRGRGGEGRERAADLEQRPQHLGHGDRSGDCARHGLHVGDARDLQHRRRHRVAVDRHRPGDPGEGGVRAIGASGKGILAGCRDGADRVGLPLPLANHSCAGGYVAPTTSPLRGAIVGISVGDDDLHRDDRQPESLRPFPPDSGTRRRSRRSEIAGCAQAHRHPDQSSSPSRCSRALVRVALTGSSSACPRTSS